MGYTHYWRQSRDFTTEEWSEIETQTKTVLANLPDSIKLVAGPEDASHIIEKETFFFNGLPTEDLSHEDFLLEKTARSFAFCKTARKPSDVAVVAVLLIAAHVAPEAITVTSDGWRN